MSGTPSLIYHGRFKIIITETHDPNIWYQWRQHCDDLSVWAEFRERIAAKAHQVAAGAIYTLEVRELGENLTNEKIEAALPKDHFCEESAVSAILLEMISCQLDGDAGHLTDMGRANLFYTSSSVARVCRSWVREDWNVDAFDRDEDHEWVVGDLVFSFPRVLFRKLTPHLLSA